MSYSPVSVENFGGLNLVDDPGTIGWSEAIDLLDVDLDYLGRVRQRWCFITAVADTTLTSPRVLQWANVGYLASTAASLKLYTFPGTLVATAVAPNVYYSSGIQAFGTPSTSYLYLADNANTNAIRRLTTAGVISAPAGMPTAKFLARSPNDNRLVAACVSGSTSRVQFSNAGDAETWGANDYVDLDPGDGESIMGAATYRDLLIVWKATKFYVFYGTSTDSSGNPIFNYRAYRAGVGMVSSTVPPVVGEDGVYFYGQAPGGRFASGVFRTRGAEAEFVSSRIQGAFSDDPPSTFSPGYIQTVNDMTFAEGRVWLSCTTSGSPSHVLFGYDPRRDNWTVYGLPGANPIAGYNGRFLVVASTGANAPTHHFDSTATSDSLRTPTPLYRSGFSDLGTPDIKTIREWKLQGYGTPTFKTATDFGSLSTGSTVTLGTSPAIAEGRDRTAVRGRQIGWQVSGTAAFSLNNLVAHTREKKSAGTDE